MATNEKFKDKPLKDCISHLEEIAENKNTEENIADLRALIKNLIKSNRFFDISSLYVFLKNAAANGHKTGVFFEPAKSMLQENLKNLFIKSITYNNTELRRMFSDILGNDNGLVIELVSFIFDKYELFNFRFSDNINRQLIEIAEADLSGFIDHANPGFLAFYLASLPKISFVPQKHIEQLTNLILYKTDSQKQTAKILTSMYEYPSADILLIFILSPRESDRLQALQILKSRLSMEKYTELRESFAEKAPYFIRTAMTSGLFYDFHNIPLTHKELFAAILKYTDVRLVKEIVIPMLRRENTDGDPIITDSKIAFIPAFRDFIPLYSDLVPELTKILRDEKIEIDVKEEIRKLLLEFK